VMPPVLEQGWKRNDMGRRGCVAHVSRRDLKGARGQLRRLTAVTASGE
jgi:hypothetical protein